MVIGGVAAGLSAASRARRIDRSLEIVVLEKGETISYSACGLPWYLAGRINNAESLITYTPDYFLRERNIKVRTRAEVTSILHARREVTLSGGERIGYDRLVIATGARPARASIPGADLPHVFTLHTLRDAVRLREYVETRRPQRASVIGAGYIGLEAAEALSARGIKVTVFDSSEYALGRDDSALASILRSRLERFHVELCLNTRVTAIEPDGVNGVQSDLVVMATGVVPNTELAAEAGVKIGPAGAIQTTDRMETNFGGVFAAGDCAETVHIVTGRPVYIPLGSTANKMGRVAGANAAGGRERFPGVAGTSIVSVCGLGVACTGLSEAEAKREGFDPVSVRIEAGDRPRYFQERPVTVELVADRRSRRLIGGLVLGEGDAALRINVMAAAVTSRMRIEDFAQLDLAYAPPFAPVWDPLLVAARQLNKLLD